MALWKRGRRYWTYFSVNGVQLRRPLCPQGSTRATTNWQEALRLEKEMIRAAVEGELAPRDPSVKLFAAIDDYLEAKKATANSERTIEFDRERLEIVKRHLGDVKLSTITRNVIEGFQAKRRLEGSSNRTINMDVGALRQVLRRFKQWRRLEDDVKMLTEAGGAPVGRALTPAEQKRLFEAAASNPEWEHVYCAAVLAANTSMRGVEVKHVRRRNIDLEKVWDVESATGKGVLYVTRSKNETSKRPIPLNQAAREAVERMLKRADDLGHTDPEHYVWCASQHHKIRSAEAREQVGRRLAVATESSWFTWIPVSRSAAHCRHRSAGGRRTRPRDPGRDRAALQEDAGALLAPAAQGKGSDAHPDGRATEEEGKRLKPPTMLTIFGAFSAGWLGMLCGRYLVGR